MQKASGETGLGCDSPAWETVLIEQDDEPISFEHCDEPLQLLFEEYDTTKALVKMIADKIALRKEWRRQDAIKESLRQEDSRKVMMRALRSSLPHPWLITNISAQPRLDKEAACGQYGGSRDYRATTDEDI